MPTGSAITVATATITIVPTIAFAIPPVVPRKFVVGPFVKKSTDSALWPRSITARDHEREDGDRRQRGDEHHALDELVHDLSPAQLAGRRKRELCAVAHRPSSWRSKRRTITCAAMFVISENTSNTSAR